MHSARCWLCRLPVQLGVAVWLWSSGQRDVTGSLLLVSGGVFDFFMESGACRWRSLSSRPFSFSPFMVSYRWGCSPWFMWDFRVGRWLWRRRAAELVTGQAISELTSRKNIHSLFIHASAVRISICNQNNLKVIAKFYVTYKCGAVCVWYRTLVFPYILPLRFFVRYEDLLSCNHLSCFFFSSFFSSKSSFAIFKQREEY